jgi:hypothetical protein
MESLIKNTIGNERSECSNVNGNEEKDIIPQIISCNANDDNLLISLNYEAYSDKLTVDEILSNINNFYNKIEIIKD